MIGSRIGPYSILSELGSGGMGRVYLAEVVGKAPGLDDGVKVALKVIHPHLLETPGFFKRFLREAEIGKSVHQDNVVRCFDCDQLVVDGAHQNFLVMEYVEGQTLRGLLNELERVPEELCRHIGREIAKGLVAIHEAGAIHRDLKPENVLITEDHVVKVMDLGVARLQDEVVRLSQTGAFVGSLEYACPEQFRGGGAGVDARSDLYALGVMLYELSTGQHPYRTDDTFTTIHNVIEGKARRAGEVNPQLSPFFEEVVHALAAKEPGDRFSAASGLLEALEEGEKSEWWKQRAKALRIETKCPLRRIRIPRETALYGRDEDLAKLHALYDRTRAGDGHVLLIEGEAGIGKTRLVDEFVGRLRQEGEDINFLFGSYPPGGAATASGAFSTAYREHFGSAVLEETLKSYLTITPLLVPAFAALLRGDATPTGAEPLTKDSLQTVFVYATRGLAAERPTIVLIDDLHFAPEEGRALFSSLALAVPDHRILLIGTMRPGVSETWSAGITRLDQAEQRSLSRLGPRNLFQLLKDSFRSERLAEELGLRISVKCDGNPFFAFEIIRGLREGQFIAQKPDGTWVTTKEIQDIQVPASVLDLVQARIADLGDEARNLLDVASCCGYEFDPVLVAQALGIGEIPALQRLARVENRHRLVRSAGPRFVFDHHQVQEALYGGLPDPLRERYHAAIARTLELGSSAAEKHPEDLDGALCVDLAEHFLRGAQGRTALRYLDAALTHLENGYLNHQALALADRALAVPGLLGGPQRVEVLVRKAGRLDLLGRREAQHAVLEEARALADAAGDPGLRARVRASLGWLLCQVAENARAESVLNVARELARSAGDRKTEATATGNLGHVFHALGRPAEAQAQYERCLALAREIGDRRGEAQATGNLGLVFQALGRLGEAQAQHERNLVLAREIGDRRGEAAATGNLGLVFHALGRLAEAHAQYERCLALAREIGARHLEAQARGNLGLVLHALGRLTDAQAQHERDLVLAREIGDRGGEAAATGNLGLVFKDLGRYAEALAQYERCLALAREIGARRLESLATGNLGSLFASQGRYAEAYVRLERYLALSREIGDRLGEGFALLSLASLADEQERAEEAWRLAHDSLALRREIGHADGVADSLSFLGDLLVRTGRVEDARATLEEALALSRDQGRAAQVALVLANLARLPHGDVSAAEASLQAADDAGAAFEVRYHLWKATGKQEHLQEAKRLLDYRVEHAREEYRQSMLENVRLNREIMSAWKALHPERAKRVEGHGKE